MITISAPSMITGHRHSVVTAKPTSGQVCFRAELGNVFSTANTIATARGRGAFLDSQSATLG